MSIRTTGLVLAVPALVAAIACSLAIGTRSIPLATVLQSLLHGADGQDAVIVTECACPGRSSACSSARRSASRAR